MLPYVSLVSQSIVNFVFQSVNNTLSHIFSISVDSIAQWLGTWSTFFFLSPHKDAAIPNGANVRVSKFSFANVSK